MQIVDRAKTDNCTYFAAYSEEYSSDVMGIFELKPDWASSKFEIDCLFKVVGPKNPPYQ